MLTVSDMLFFIGLTVWITGVIAVLYFDDEQYKDVCAYVVYSGWALTLGVLGYKIWA